MTNMKIRQATFEDVKQITEIAESLKYNIEKVQTNGFLVYVLDESGYRSRIRYSPHFYVAESDGEVDGFLMAYSDATFKRMIGSMSHEDGLVRFLLERRTHFIFADQIGVKNGIRRSGIGNELMSRLFEDMKTASIPIIYAGILHEPTRNVASVKFCEDLGFKNIGEVQNSDLYHWGVYGKLVGGAGER